MKGLSKALQDSGLKIGKALDHINVVSDSLKDCMTDNDCFHSQLHEKACNLAEQFDVKVKVPMISKRQTMRNNVPLADLNQYNRLAVTTKFLDHLLSEMTERFTDMNGKIVMAVKLIPGMMKIVPSVSDFEFFEDDVESMDLLETELHQWFRKWKEQNEKPGTIELTLAECDERFYKNLKTIFQYSQTPKTYLRSSMGKERLCGFALLYIHGDFEVNIRDICREFAQWKSKRMMLPEIPYFC